ncbi:MAG: geranylgeranylglycerol-phosphate geranylgeranyltransferase, partial [Mesonia sp.]
DVEADAINKPQKVIVGKQVSEKTAYNLFLIFNVIGVLLGFYLSNMIGRPVFSGIFIMVSGVLYLYATTFKSYLVVGNLLISALVALVIILPGLFDLLPAITPQNQDTQRTFLSILVDYAIFAFLINWLREMVKDQQDIQGDHKAEIQTLPIALGQERTNKLIFTISMIPLLAILYYIYAYLYQNMYAMIYAIIFILAPLLWFMFKIISAKNKKEFSNLSGILKLILVFGIVSIALYPFLWK